MGAADGVTFGKTDDIVLVFTIGMTDCAADDAALGITDGTVVGFAVGMTNQN